MAEIETPRKRPPVRQAELGPALKALSKALGFRKEGLANMLMVLVDLTDFALTPEAWPVASAWLASEVYASGHRHRAPDRHAVAAASAMATALVASLMLELGEHPELSRSVLEKMGTVL